MEKTFEISTAIYDTEAIIAAIADFSEVAKISFKKDILTISWDSEVEVIEVFREFMNYVLSL